VLQSPTTRGIFGYQSKRKGKETSWFVRLQVGEEKKEKKRQEGTELATNTTTEGKISDQFEAPEKGKGKEKMKTERRWSS